VLWQIAEFRYAGENDIYEAARAVDWPALFAVERTLRVYVTAQKSPLKSLEFITLRIKDAVCDRFRDGRRQPPEHREGASRCPRACVSGGERGSLYLDTSGEPLFKRGWRRSSVEAPLRENLAAGIVLLSGWNREEPLLDPMCGGGTLLIEAAAIALDVAPGAGRMFGFERLAAFDAALWRRVRDGRGARAKRKLSLFGSDVDPRAIVAARKNLAAAGFSDRVQLERADVLERTAPAEGRGARDESALRRAHRQQR
jgi:putative N6-adenine-specific DNA methylase